MSNTQLKHIDYRWQDEASCRGLHPDLFYPERGHPIKPEIKALCADCPVQKSCLEHGLHHEKHGFWGGMTEDQRAIVRRQLNIRVKTPETIYNQSANEVRREAHENRPRIRGRGRKTDQ